jgi:hypothetical protein
VLAGAIQEDAGSGLWRDFAKRTQFVLFGSLGSTAITDGSRGEARAVQYWTPSAIDFKDADLLSLQLL